MHIINIEYEILLFNQLIIYLFQFLIYILKPYAPLSETSKEYQTFLDI